MSASVWAKNDELKIAYDSIPAAAQNFIKTNFEGVAVKKAYQMFDDGIAEYKVYLKNKIVINFDMVGAWNYIETSKGVLPDAGFLPERVLDTVLARFADKKIKRLENDGYLYKVMFSDGSEVKINVNGTIVE